MMVLTEEQEPLYFESVDDILEGMFKKHDVVTRSGYVIVRCSGNAVFVDFKALTFEQMQKIVGVWYKGQVEQLQKDRIAKGLCPACGSEMKQEPVGWLCPHRCFF